jgi:hypothetical protein
MIVLAEPMSIAIESETRFLRALRPRRVLVFPMNDIKARSYRTYKTYS